jgi:hypothetical protein
MEGKNALNVPFTRVEQHHLLDRASLKIVVFGPRMDFGARSGRKFTISTEYTRELLDDARGTRRRAMNA